MIDNVLLQALMLNPVQVLKRGAEEERSETARLVRSTCMSAFTLSSHLTVYSCYNSDKYQVHAL